MRSIRDPRSAIPYPLSLAISSPSCPPIPFLDPLFLARHCIYRRVESVHMHTHTLHTHLPTDTAPALLRSSSLLPHFGTAPCTCTIPFPSRWHVDACAPSSWSRQRAELCCRSTNLETSSTDKDGVRAARRIECVRFRRSSSSRQRERVVWDGDGDGDRFPPVGISPGKYCVDSPFLR